MLNLTILMNTSFQFEAIKDLSTSRKWDLKLEKNKELKLKLL